MTPRWILPTVLTLAMPVSAHAATIQITMENLVIAPAKGRRHHRMDQQRRLRSHGDGIPPKKTATLILKKAGPIDYYCRFHPNNHKRHLANPLIADQGHVAGWAKVI